jgi:glucans biosynthesis protein
LRLLICALALFGSLAPASATAHRRFTFDHVAEAARKLATESYRAPAQIPDFLSSLSYDDFRDIRFDTAKSWWRESGNFQIQFIHPGLYYRQAVKINTVDPSGVSTVRFSPQLFDYSRNKIVEKIPPDLGSPAFASPTRSTAATSSIM